MGSQCCPKKKIYNPFELTEDSDDSKIYKSDDDLFPSDEEYHKEMNAFEEKFLLQEIPFEDYVICLFKIMGKDLTTEQEKKVPSLNAYEEIYNSPIDTESFANELLKKFKKEKGYELTRISIISMGETISNHIKKKGMDRLFVLHMMSIGFLYCKGGDLRKLEFFYELFKINDLEPSLHYDSYSIMFIFIILIVATLGNFEAQKKTKLLKESMEEDLNEKFCQIPAINGFEKEIFDKLLGISSDDSKKLDEYKITWQELRERYFKKEIKFWPFSACCIRKYIRQRIERFKI